MPVLRIYDGANWDNLGGGGISGWSGYSGSIPPVFSYPVQSPTITGSSPTFYCTINWLNGAKQKLLLPNVSGTTTITFTNAPATCMLQLILVQGTVATSIVLPTVKWQNGIPYTANTNPSSVDIISFLYDGTYYYGAFGLNFS